VGKTEGRNHLKHLGLYGRLRLKCILKKRDGVGGIDWTDLVQDRDR
jgi:hypothetical protein